MSNLREKAFKICTKWDSIGKTCLEERYAVWLEDAQKELLELKQKLRKQVSELKDVISNAPFSESNRRALWIIHDVEKLLKEEKRK
jgi:hypothetical protein